MAKLIGKQPFHALKVDAVRHDCGDKAGFVIANLAMALERDDVGPQGPRGYRVGSRPRPGSSRRSSASLAAKRSLQLADRDRALDDPRVERRIVLAQPLDAIARARSARSMRANSTSKWNGLRMTSSAPAS